jgi:hypothetical protein
MLIEMMAMQLSKTEEYNRILDVSTHRLDSIVKVHIVDDVVVG